MFTGLIQQRATLESLEPSEGGARISVRLEEEADLARGESISVNGVCLTAQPCSALNFTADLSAETLLRTTFGKASPGARLNIERALRLSDRLGGHLVQGHVDATGQVLLIQPQGAFTVMRWSFPAEHSALIVEKGSICVDGVSLTITEPEDTSFGAALIPETLQRTILSGSVLGGTVNLEFDLMAKFARKMLSPYANRSQAG